MNIAVTIWAFLLFALGIATIKRSPWQYVFLGMALIAGLLVSFEVVAS